MTDDVTVHHGDALDVLAGMPDASVDAVVTDPPYNLSDSGKRDADCLRRILGQIHLPDDQQGDAKGSQRGDLTIPALSRPPLRGEHGSAGVDTRIGVPEGAVDLQDSPIGESEVHDGDVSAEGTPDADLALVYDAEPVEHLGDYILASTNGGDAPFCDGTCSCFTEPTAGVIAVPVIAPSYAGGDGASSGVGVRRSDEHVGRGNDSTGEAESASGVVAGPGAVRGAVLRLDLGRRTGKLRVTDSAPQDNAPLFVLAPKPVGAAAGARGLSAVAEPGQVSFVSDSTHRTFSLHLPWHEIKSTRQSRGFMGKTWDGWDSPASFQRWCKAWAVECLRLLRPGGHLLAFGGTRTFHRLACAIEDAGFEIRDTISWLYGSGFPKSLDVSKAIDKRRDWSLVERLSDEIRRARADAGMSLAETGQAMLAATDGTYGKWYHRGGHMFFETGRSLPSRPEWEHLRHVLPIAPEFAEVYDEAEREVTGVITGRSFDAWEENTRGYSTAPNGRSGLRHDIPATDDARRWQGWGTALKPAWEPVIVARKPLAGTVAGNVLAHGTGALNIDATRVGTGGQLKWAEPRDMGYHGGTDNGPVEATSNHLGRWPANVVLDEDAAAQLDRQSGTSVSRSGGVAGWQDEYVGGKYTPIERTGHDDFGGASRFYYTAKAAPDERPRVNGTSHPTVKPLELMRWLVRLVTPPGGLVLDPFAGSGTTGEACIIEGFRAVLIEREAEYLPLIEARLSKPIQPTLGGLA